MERPSTAEVRSAISAFRDVVERTPGEDFAALISAVTKLMEPDEGDPAPRHSSQEDHAVIQARFPSLYERSSDNQTAADEWTHTPWDDLGDLYRDMRAVEECLKVDERETLAGDSVSDLRATGAITR